MSTKANILVIDDEPDIRQLVREILEDEGYEVRTAENGETARQARRDRRADLILLDIWMPDIDGVSLLKEWMEEGGAKVPVVMMSGHGTVETAVEATRLGAYDYLEKPLTLAKLLLTVERALEAVRLQQENIGLRQHNEPMSEPFGKSTVMHALREQLQRIAHHDTSVLMSGESGSGRHICARFLHSNSTRRDGPFIEVGAAQIAGDTTATELFGEEVNGSIHYGRLEQANGGTLFISDVADMSPAAQASLFSALEARSFLRVGGNEPVQIDVRVVAATARDLEQEVNARRFREDLYYQLNIVPVYVPPLREHREDVPDLLNYFVNLYAERDGLPYRAFSVAAQNRLRNYSWPGNIRELDNIVQRLLIAGSSNEISLDEVETILGDETRQELTGVSALYALPLKQARERFEKSYFEYQLRQAEGSVGKVAKLTGVERTHLYRKLRALGIDPKKIDGGK